MGSLVVACELSVAACVWDLVPWPGIEPRPLALGARSLNHCTTREVPNLWFSITLFLCEQWHTSWNSLLSSALSGFWKAATDFSKKITHEWQSELGINLSSIIPGTMTPGRISTHRCVALDLLSNISESQTHHLQNEDNIYLLRSLSRLRTTRKWRQQAEYMTHGEHLVHDNYLKLMAQLCSTVQNANQFLLCKISSLC